MTSKSIYIILAVIVILILGVGVYVYASKPQSNQSTGTGNVVAGSTSTTGAKVKFSDSNFANNAYLISDPTLDANAQAAISGFTLNRQTLADGSLKVTLVAVDPSYQDQSYVVQPGEKLYFIENSMMDDAPPSTENTLRDDHAVLVDADGYIVGSPGLA